jgi:hypothetical protein
MAKLFICCDESAAREMNFRSKFPHFYIQSKITVSNEQNMVILQHTEWSLVIFVFKNTIIPFLQFVISVPPDVLFVINVIFFLN